MNRKEFEDAIRSVDVDLMILHCNRYRAYSKGLDILNKENASLIEICPEDPLFPYLTVNVKVNNDVIKAYDRGRVNAIKGICDLFESLQGRKPVAKNNKIDLICGWMERYERYAESLDLVAEEDTVFDSIQRDLMKIYSSTKIDCLYEIYSLIKDNTEEEI